MISEISPILIIIALVAFSFILLQKNKMFHQQNTELKKQLNIDLEELTRQKLVTSTPMETIKYLRVEHGLSLVEAKQLVNSLDK